MASTEETLLLIARNTAALGFDHTAHGMTHFARHSAVVAPLRLNTPRVLRPETLSRFVEDIRAVQQFFYPASICTKKTFPNIHE